MKTISQYLDQIPDKDVRERAKRNCTNPDMLAPSVHRAIALAFSWELSPEGAEYWTVVCGDMRDYTPPLTQLQRSRREIKRLYRYQRSRIRHKRRFLRLIYPQVKITPGRCLRMR